MIYAENQPCPSRNCDSWLKVRRRPAGWKPDPSYKYQYAVWYVCKHGHTHFNDVDKRFPEHIRAEKTEKRLFNPDEITVVKAPKPSIIAAKSEQKVLGPARMSATQAARATAGRHLLTNLLRARYVDQGDEDVTETMGKIEKRKQRSLKRKMKRKTG